MNYKKQIDIAANKEHNPKLNASYQIINIFYKKAHFQLPNLNLIYIFQI